MAKITLHENSKSFTVITFNCSKFHLPCLGEDGCLYCLFSRIVDGLGVIRDDMDFLDEKQKLCVKLQDKVIHRNMDIEYIPIPNWDKAIFDKVDSFEEYIQVWEDKNNKRWIIQD